MSDIYKNIKKIKQEIENISKNNSKLCCVTKYSDFNQIKEALSSNYIKIIGESKVQEAKEKFTLLQMDFLTYKISKHMIGHLQSNKIRIAVQLFDCIESVDSIKLANLINQECKKINKVMEIYMQINISEETQKHGFNIKKVKSAYNALMKLKNLNLIGIMGIAPKVDNPEKSRPYFKKLKRIADKLNLKEISMGMSNDYKIALEEGATLIRIGSAIFN